MFRYNNGIIITTDNCIGCNYCISQCSIMGANVSATKNGKKIIAVDSNKCNHCGKCIAMCKHNARDYFDDNYKFFDDLKNGEKISVILDPSFSYIYGDKAYKIISYLRSIGVDKVYNGAFGYEISLWGTVKYLKDHYNDPTSTKAFIANNCPAMVNVIEMKFPSLLRKIIPIQSGTICSAIYTKKYLQDTNKIAYFGPCIAKKDEIISENTNNYINYSLTFKHIWEQIQNVNFDSYEASGFDLDPIGFGMFLGRKGFYRQIISHFFDCTDILTIESGLGDLTFNKFLLYIDDRYTNLQPLFTETYACPSGCFEGPGIDSTCYEKGENFSRFASLFKSSELFFNKNISYEEKTEQLYDYFKNLEYSDFLRNFTERYKQPFHISDSIYNDIFNSMLKDTEEKRNIDCGTCGYKTCKNMATAIAYSYNKKENCIHYMNDEMRNRIYTDEVALCPNKDAFVEYVNKLLEDNPEKHYRIYCGDINKYKVINELYGSDIGDNVLRIISRKLSELIDDEGFYARITSGQFAICIEESVDNFQKIMNLKSFDCSELGINYPITMRFGFYSMLENPENVSVMYMINCAVLSMDQKSSLQENTYCQFSQELKNKQHDEAQLATLMKPALDNNEFVLYYQPQYSTISNKLVGAEALCRWINKDGNIISPGVFIPVTEKNGFIRYLDKEIWRKAFSTLRKWIDEGLDPVPVSLNISRVSLESEGIFYTIKHLKDEYKIPPELIHFEITESAYMGDQDNFLSRINLIRSLGFKIAMDDFGSGYSSLNTLKDIPFDIIKLDMGFLKSKSKTKEEYDKGGAIISSIVRMAQKLNFVTVAEGVEMIEQAAFLKGIGCDVIQGFLYSKPMPESAYKNLLLEKDKEFDIKLTRPVGRLNIGSFMNPTTEQYIFFENFIGPAFICEYFPNIPKINIIRINIGAKKLFDFTDSTFEEINMKIQTFVHNQLSKNIIEALNESTQTLNEVDCMFNFTNRKNENKNIKLKIWQISTNHESFACYCSIEDITEFQIK